jgi:hypothetical protein
MRVCSVCNQSGHNARTCPQSIEKLAPKTIQPDGEKLEQVKRAVALQNIGEVFLAQDIKDNIVPLSTLEDPSFWDFDQRKLIARELIKLRSVSKEVIIIKDIPRDIPILPHVPGKLLEVKPLEENDATLI